MTVKAECSPDEPMTLQRVVDRMAALSMGETAVTDPELYAAMGSLQRPLELDDDMEPLHSGPCCNSRISPGPSTCDACDNASERASERSAADYYGGSGPQTEQERHQQAYKEKYQR